MSSVPVFAIEWTPYKENSNYKDSSGNYITDVPGERASDPQEVILMEKPSSLVKPTLHEVIFNPTLSNEFLFEYQNRFGRTEQEQNYYLTNRQGYYRNSTGTITINTEDQERKKFAEYMLRRLTEYHIDNYMKTEPSMRRVYEIKQAVSNVKVQVGSQFKCDVNYNYSGNSAKIACLNPIANTLLNIQMNPSQFLPTTPSEMTLGLERPITRTIFLETHYQFYEGGLTAIVTKNFTPSFSTNLTGGTYLKEKRERSPDLPTPADSSNPNLAKENLIILGAKVIF